MQRTELQILLQALTAIQYEMRATALMISSEPVSIEVRKLRSDAKTLMQSSTADADLIALRAGTKVADGSGGWEEESYTAIDENIIGGPCRNPGCNDVAGHPGPCPSSYVTNDIGKHNCDDPFCRSCHNCGATGVPIDSSWNLCAKCDHGELPIIVEESL